MKNINFNFLTKSLLLTFVFINTSCERELSDEATLATFSKTGEIFIDAPIGMGSNFYFPYGPDAANPIGSKLDAWSVDNEVGYNGSSASMRFDVPSANDLEGNYAGAIFRIDGAGRDLTGYDALTFYAKASQGVTIGEFGFGEDFYPNKYIATITNVSLGTNWKKYIIPIPDASKLVQEKGMFRYAAGTQQTNGNGYIFWIDDLKFEKLGTIAHPQPKILNGINTTQQAYTGTKVSITDLTQTFNLASGINQTINCAPSYFEFTSSNTDVASVDELGVVTVVGSGSAIISATLGGVAAQGNLTINSLGVFIQAAEPQQPADKVISLFSDKYDDVPVDFFNGYWGGSTTQTALLNINGNEIQSYTSLNYVGIQTNTQPVNATQMQFLHLDILPRTTATTSFIIKIRDRGANGVINSDGNGNPTLDDKEIVNTIPANQLTVGTWKSIDIALTGNILNQKNNLALITFIGNNNFYLDNLYYYKN